MKVSDSNAGGWGSLPRVPDHMLEDIGHSIMVMSGKSGASVPGFKYRPLLTVSPGETALSLPRVFLSAKPGFSCTTRQELPSKDLA